MEERIAELEAEVAQLKEWVPLLHSLFSTLNAVAADPNLKAMSAFLPPQVQTLMAQLEG